MYVYALPMWMKCYLLAVLMCVKWKQAIKFSAFLNCTWKTLEVDLHCTSFNTRQKYIKIFSLEFISFSLALGFCSLYRLLDGFLHGYSILNHLDVTMGYIVDWSRSSLPHTNQVLRSVFVDDDRPQFKCIEFARIGWKLFALFSFNILYLYIYVDYSLFPIEFEDGTVKSKRSTYTQSVRAASTIILHRLKSSNPLRVRNEPVQVVCAVCMFCMCVITPSYEWHATRLSLRSYVCVCLCVCITVDI